MIELRIEDEQGNELRKQTLEGDEIAIGRARTNQVSLPTSSVSGTHARLYRENGQWLIADQQSTNGTFLNGRPVEMPIPICDGDQIQVGSFRLWLVSGAPRAAGPSTVPEKAPASSQPQKSAEQSSEEKVREIKSRIHKKLIEFLDLRWVDLSKLAEAQIREQTRSAIENILRELAWEIPVGLNREELIKQVLDEALGLGPLEDLLADDQVSEIMVNRFDQIYIERKGKLTLSDKKLLQQPGGARRDRAHRRARSVGASTRARRWWTRASRTARASTRSSRRWRSRGPCITIRKFTKTPLTVDDLVRFGAMTRGMADFLSLCVTLRRNIVDLRRHRLGQDDAPEHALVVHPRRTSASSPSRTPPSCSCPGARRVARVAPAEPRGQGRDHASATW